MSNLVASRDQLVALTCYFNPGRYRSRYENYGVFADGIRRSGVRLLTIECAFDDEPFVLPSEDSVRVRAKDWMWQKERLLNVGLEGLPKESRFVAWLDCDIVFRDSDWWQGTIDLLASYPVVQPFTKVVRLGRSNEPEHVRLSYCSERPTSPFPIGKASHGHAGFAWAARRETLDALGFYDACLGGSGDHLMAHAFCGDFHSPCVNSIIRIGSEHWRHYLEWAKRAYRRVDGSLAAVPGEITHLWHGDMADRRYEQRNQELKRFALNPSTDLRRSSEGTWEWASSKPALHAWARSCFHSRHEDGA